MSKDLFHDLKEILNGAEEDADKFYDKGNKAAGTRVRKAMQELKKKAQDVRVDIQEIKREM
jgi:hypothetical protein